jgi:DCN1-like protein 1/2
VSARAKPGRSPTFLINKYVTVEEGESTVDTAKADKPKTEEEKPKDAAAKRDADGLDLPTYAEALGVDFDGTDIYVLTDLWHVEGFQFTRKVFVDGWKRVWEETGGKVSPNMDAHRKFFRSRVDLIQKDPDYFKKVYRNAFIAGREPGQREMDMGRALDFWLQLFKPTMNGWRSANVEWCVVWHDYLMERFWVEVDKNGKDVPKDKQPQEGEKKQEGEQAPEDTPGRWTRSVSKDLWNQTLIFATKTLQDETLGFWSEDQAWPGIIDDFVVWCRDKGVIPAGNGGGMEVDK